ncbi:metal ABC transporter substrate-binding protein [Yinghuangia sp. ASG 101]|uniref:metal ABC transporter substrate-binding protein n=1 Tax=Yinghuangia sp. ASG 101 TaxID=2896848 RepID=UPI001E47FC07|nr:metal ABC transporter substrate-binding protein [Yinghuangia sp. ASG 101]UGQ09864.1 metal ABC transporter substrate-binding protein [Yinghuangia sp. ASG 101]
MKIRRLGPVPLLAATAASALILSACGGSDDAGDKSGSGPVDVVAAFYPLKFVTEQVGGPEVTITNLTKPGAEPHDLELTAKQVAAISDSDVVVYLKGLQPAVDDAVSQNKPGHVVDAAVLSPLEEHGTDVEGEDHGHDEGDEHGEDDGHNHAVADGGDPHLWLDPTRLAAVAAGVGETLAAADPGHAQDYRNRAADLKNRLDALDQEFRTGLTSCARKEIVTSHAAFGYLAERYGLHQIAVNGVNPGSEPSPARIAEIQQLVKEKGVTTIFFETLATPKIAETLARDTGVTTAVLDPLEGIKDESQADYFSVMHGNLDALRTALGCS